jgi:hypothetical protein
MGGARKSSKGEMLQRVKWSRGERLEGVEWLRKGSLGVRGGLGKDEEEK